MKTELEKEMNRLRDDIEKSKFLPGDGPLIDKLKADKYLWC